MTLTEATPESPAKSQSPSLLARSSRRSTTFFHWPWPDATGEDDSMIPPPLKALSAGPPLRPEERRGREP